MGEYACFRVHLEQTHLFLIEKTYSPPMQDIEYTDYSQIHLKPLKNVPPIPWRAEIVSLLEQRILELE